ncbi:MAG: hypothetical protein NTX25_07370 [Proteobacteria bacterium]|nr:hypothetical protein [Pseudomonadota bacterium]
MLIIGFLASIVIIAALSVLVWSSHMRTSIILGALALLFLPFGLLVGLGYLAPKALNFILSYRPLKEVEVHS